MIVGYSQPAISGAVAIAGGGGLAAPTWLTVDGGAALFDGRPTRKARLQWGTGTPSIAHYVDISATFATATPLRVLALLGTTLPVGVRVDFLGAGGDGLGGTCDNARTVRMPDGTVGVWALARADDPAETGAIVRIYNDCNGSPWATGGGSGTVIDVGELVAMPGVEIEQSSDWDADLVDPAEVALSRSSQADIVARSPYSVLNVPLSASSAGQVSGAGLGNGMDWYKLRAALSGSARSAAILRASPLVAQYGFGRISSIRHLGGDYFSAQFRHQEIPAA